MNIDSIIRRVTGAAKNAVVWGAAWFILAMAVFGVSHATGVGPAHVSLLDAIGMSIRVGVMGGITGGAFSAFIGTFYRGRRLSEINWVRFGIGGAVVGGSFVAAFLVSANLLTGGGLPALGNIFDDIIIGTGFGGATAAATMWLAQRAERVSGGSDDEIEHQELERLEGADPLANLAARVARQHERGASRRNG
ncbi:MAG TPA: hypothetical protein VFK04_05115 [Gemmatimonadaceae bacterium]|nr:hypothetical protein [Gemmatimonadaceae bacterium]